MGKVDQEHQTHHGKIGYKCMMESQETAKKETEIEEEFCRMILTAALSEKAYHVASAHKEKSGYQEMVALIKWVSRDVAKENKLISHLMTCV